MKSIIDYFIIGHTEEALSNTSFLSLPHVNYVLVGNNHQSKNTNYIVSKFLKNNIEENNNLCSYTAWHSIAKNSLNTNDYISLLEYDINIHENFHNYTYDKILGTSSLNFVIAYSYTIFNHYVFYKSTPWLEIFLSKVYNINIDDFVKENKARYNIWPTTTNLTMPKCVFDNFIEWFDPFISLSKNHPLSAYVHERAFFVYCVLHNIKIIYLPNILTHHQLQSHHINDIYGGFLKQKGTNIFAPHMVEEYDKIYNAEYQRCMDHLDKRTTA